MSARGRWPRSEIASAKRVLRPEPSDVVPRLAAEPRSLQEIARLPHQRNAALGNAGQAAEIEPRPWQERILPPIGPDFDAHARPHGQPARVEPDSVRDDQRVGGHGEGARLAKTHPRNL